MKKLVVLALTLVCTLCPAGCKQASSEDVFHLGLNAEIIEIDASNHIIYVSDIDESDVFGERCAIDCQKLITDQKIIYVDYNTLEVVLIEFSDLAVGDHVIINAYESQLNSIQDTREVEQVEQIQLGTQRLHS